MICVVTGGSRGIGRETVRQLAAAGHTVVLTSRTESAAHAADVDGDVIGHPLDITDDDSVQALVAFLTERFGRIDVLVNNAARIAEPSDGNLTRSTPAQVEATLHTNVVGSYRVTQALLPLLSQGGNIVNVSSGMGGLTHMNGGHPGYRMSKAALNALTRIVDAETPANLRVNSVCPGWVRTDMGGPHATRDVAHGARGVVWAATLDSDGPSGGFFRDGEPIPF